MATQTITATEAPDTTTLQFVDIDSSVELTKSEQLKMQEAWLHLLRLCGITVAHDTAPVLTAHLTSMLTNKSPESFREILWNFILAEHPDAPVLRFMRARKWDVRQAMEMLVSALNWRDERRIDHDIIAKGESVGLQSEMSKDNQGFISQYQSGKSYVRGADKEGRPLYVIKVRLHDPKNQTSQAMENYVLHNIESIKTMLSFPNDKACLIFDLTGFGVKNMDFHVVKFLVTVFEARYPETLGLVLIHKAPFVFWGIWSIIKGWLDPVIASKINFTSSTKDLMKFVDKDQLHCSYGGDDTWEYKYIDPVPGENERMEQVEKRNEVRSDRDELAKQFEQATLSWLSKEPHSEEWEQLNDSRRTIASQLRSNYWMLDPYVRARSYYHRSGMIGASGEVDFKAAK
ncbi:Phosphatidylinositol transfer protein-like protein [Emericellopsis cladophorae]|uniref:Phosphatidylinositol transfer protein-like protein n=1 Tax=Emericellopsis cladophorae TaxID=2686198 RepID=A0A9P9XTX5_9HYPO|nr:Phosphatidylinositol transfer protein-like protein [Emericellopsis cladophorae]KAI6777729.1 Phosphatidylinositol transfer protein-like protein [Emericellopsis cladophorae]